MKWVRTSPIGTKMLQHSPLTVTDKLRLHFYWKRGKSSLRCFTFPSAQEVIGGTVPFVWRKLLFCFKTLRHVTGQAPTLQTVAASEPRASWPASDHKCIVNGKKKKSESVKRKLQENNFWELSQWLEKGPLSSNQLSVYNFSTLSFEEEMFGLYSKTSRPVEHIGTW